MADNDDSMVERAKRVQHSIDADPKPEAVQVAVGGPCPDCGGRIETTVHTYTTEFACQECGHHFTLRT